jgi:hypothetical protein
LPSLAPPCLPSPHPHPKTMARRWHNDDICHHPCHPRPMETRRRAACLSPPHPYPRPPSVQKRSRNACDYVRCAVVAVALTIALAFHLAPPHTHPRRRHDDDYGRPCPVCPLHCPHPQSPRPRPPGNVQKRSHNVRDRVRYAVAPARRLRHLLGRIPAVLVLVLMRVVGVVMSAPVPYPKHGRGT